MKFFDCAQCLMTFNRRRWRGCNETTDPLVMTKRPSARHHRHHLESSSSASNTRRIQFLTAMRSFGASWKRRNKRPKKLLRNDESSRRVVGIPRTLNGVHLRKRKIPANVDTSRVNDTGRKGANRAAGRRAGELEREYYEHLEALKFLIDPPPCFRNTETRQNFENKLNSLDFRRMNTVAIPEGPWTSGSPMLRSSLDGFRSNQSLTRENDVVSYISERSYADALDRIVKEHVKIERTMLDLFVRAPILKNRQGEQVFLATRENKTVRFKDEETAVEHGEGLRLGDGDYEGVGSSNRVKTEITKEEEKVGLDFCRDRPPGESSNGFDVETGNGR
ncbi:uncharacterized protein LOC114930816 [Nylanderia fulva]|uniref:uncharacterized protein LOC114930816 n=1 Tax=Nylanderia fulva TaxID=613905 RepID=UPI0010FB2324|nr:uncharacterized protein LOC114930816 [Nylanderia fulva]